MSKELKILEQARSLFFKRGLRSVSMDEIAMQLGISKKTLYQFFANKAELVLRAVQFHIEEEREKTAHIHDSAGNAIDEMVAIFDHVCSYLREFNPTAIHDIQRYYPAAWEVFQAHKHTYIEAIILENIQKGMGEGLYRADLQPDMIVRFYSNGIDNLMDESNFPAHKFNLLELYSMYIRYHLRAISTEEGLDYLKKRFK